MVSISLFQVYAVPLLQPILPNIDFSQPHLNIPSTLVNKRFLSTLKLNGYIEVTVEQHAGDFSVSFD